MYRNYEYSAFYILPAVQTVTLARSLARAIMDVTMRETYWQGQHGRDLSTRGLSLTSGAASNAFELAPPTSLQLSHAPQAHVSAPMAGMPDLLVIGGGGAATEVSSARAERAERAVPPRAVAPIAAPVQVEPRRPPPQSVALAAPMADAPDTQRGLPPSGTKSAGATAMAAPRVPEVGVPAVLRERGAARLHPHHPVHTESRSASSKAAATGVSGADPASARSPAASRGRPARTERREPVSRTERPTAAAPRPRSKPGWSAAATPTPSLFDPGLERRTLMHEEALLKRQRQHREQQRQHEQLVAVRQQASEAQHAQQRELRALESQLARTRAHLVRDAAGRESQPYFAASLRRLSRLEGELRVLQQPGSLKHHGHRPALEPDSPARQPRATAPRDSPAHECSPSPSARLPLAVSPRPPHPPHRAPRPHGPWARRADASAGAGAWQACA